MDRTGRDGTGWERSDEWSDESAMSREESGDGRDGMGRERSDEGSEELATNRYEYGDGQEGTSRDGTGTERLMER